MPTPTTARAPDKAAATSSHPCPRRRPRTRRPRGRARSPSCCRTTATTPRRRVPRAPPPPRRSRHTASRTTSSCSTTTRRRCTTTTGGDTLPTAAGRPRRRSRPMPPPSTRPAVRRSEFFAPRCPRSRPRQALSTEPASLDTLPHTNPPWTEALTSQTRLPRTRLQAKSRNIAGTDTLVVDCLCPLADSTEGSVRGVPEGQRSLIDVSRIMTGLMRSRHRTSRHGVGLKHVSICSLENIGLQLLVLDQGQELLKLISYETRWPRARPTSCRDGASRPKPTCNDELRLASLPACVHILQTISKRSRSTSSRRARNCQVHQGKVPCHRRYRQGIWLS